MGSGIIRTEGHGALKLAFCRHEVPVITESHIGEGRVGLGKLRVKLKRTLRRFFGLGFGLRRRRPNPRPKKRRSVRFSLTRSLPRPTRPSPMWLSVMTGTS